MAGKNSIPAEIPSLQDIISRLGKARREQVINYEGRAWKVVEATEADRSWIMARATEQKKIQDADLLKEGGLLRARKGEDDIMDRAIRQYDSIAYGIFALIRLTRAMPEDIAAFSTEDFHTLFGLPVSAFEPLKKACLDMLNPETEQAVKEKNS